MNLMLEQKREEVEGIGLSGEYKQKATINSNVKIEHKN